MLHNIPKRCSVKMATSSDGKLVNNKMGQKKRFKWWRYNWKSIQWDYLTKQSIFST